MTEVSAPDTNKNGAANQPVKRAGRRWGRLFGITMVSAIGPVAAILFGSYLYFSGGRFVSTDNAYVKSEKIAVSADVSGRVVAVGVKENQLLEPDALLFKIDPEPYRIALEKAKAKLMFARQEIEALRALHKQKLAELKLSQGDVGFYQRQYDRQQKLNTKGFTSETNLDTARRSLRNAHDRIGSVMQDIAQVRAKLGGDPDIATDDHPAVREAAAERDQAALDLKRTEVRAVAPGVVTNFDLQAGEYVTAGTNVFSLVGTGDVWIEANFKETDLTHVRVGQVASIRVDAYPGDTREAVVASISPATGAEFALLPAQNASGNWVKVVQRLTVRLALKGRWQDPPLRAGMSVIAEIDTGHKRRLPDFARAALNWAGNLI